MPQKSIHVHRRKSLCVQTDSPLVNSRKLRSRSVFCFPLREASLYRGQPKDSRSRAESAYLPGRTQTMAILTIRGYMSSCESTINSRPAKIAGHPPVHAESPCSTPPDWGTRDIDFLLVRHPMPGPGLPRANSADLPFSRADQPQVADLTTIPDAIYIRQKPPSIDRSIKPPLLPLYTLFFAIFQVESARIGTIPGNWAIRR